MHAWQPTPPAAAIASPMMQPEFSGKLPTFWLELGGTALKEEFSMERRRLPGTETGLAVGRNHQPDMQLALKEGVTQFISREHFRVERGYASGSYCLVLVSSNPLWLMKGGVRVEATKGDPLPLATGDLIILYTGSNDLTPGGAGSKGTLHFTFHDPLQAAPPDIGFDTVRAPAGASASSARSTSPSPQSPRQERRSIRFKPNSGLVQEIPIEMLSVREAPSTPSRGALASALTPFPKAAPSGGALQLPFSIDESTRDAGKFSIDESTRDANDLFSKGGFNFNR